jgi:hypothetical protein
LNHIAFDGLTKTLAMVQLSGRSNLAGRSLEIFFLEKNVMIYRYMLSRLESDSGEGEKRTSSLRSVRSSTARSARSRPASLRYSLAKFREMGGYWLSLNRRVAKFREVGGQV